MYPKCDFDSHSNLQNGCYGSNYTFTGGDGWVGGRLDSATIKLILAPPSLILVKTFFSAVKVQ